MPADANSVACGYYFNSSEKLGNTHQHFTVLNKDTGNNHHNNKMEVYKAKPQYLSTYTLPGPSNAVQKNLSDLSNSINLATSSLSTNVSSSSNDSQPTNILFKNSIWLDLQWSKIKKIGIGLYNLGNNCYLNATLQCMAYTPSLSQWLINRPHSPGCKFKQIKGFCSLCEVEKIIYDIFNSCNGCAKPNSLCFNIKSNYLVNISLAITAF